ncbi:MAG: CoA transferase [Burkholderiales bacterium]|nr:CoA transferase [Burkholderiales bacterium]
MAEHRAKAPLAGVRVVDFTQVVAGPYCTMMLADMGAEVVKIERAGHGDDLRRTVPYAGREGHQDYFNALNRSKKSVALDLKHGEHRALALRLIARADVVVENFSPGTVERLGVGWEAVKDLNPRLVYCSLSGFGQSGPYRNRLALDPIIQAVSGIMSVTGFSDAQPTMVGAPLADVIAGMFAAYAIVNALRLVTASGGGQYIDMSMQDALLAAVGTRMGETLQAGIAPARLGNENPLRVPANTYRTADDVYIAVMVHDQEQWKPFCEALEAPEWLDDPRFRTMPLRVRNRPAMNELVARRFAQRDFGDWSVRLDRHRIPYARVNDYARALDDPQVAHRGLVREVEHPGSGRIRLVGPPWRMSRTHTEIKPPPILGQHTREVLDEWLGASDPSHAHAHGAGSGSKGRGS